MPDDIVRAPNAPEGDQTATPFAVSTETVTTHFKLVFITIVLLEVALLLAMNGMAVFVHEPTEAVKNAISTCTTLATAGFGAICGLIGGKAIA